MPPDDTWVEIRAGEARPVVASPLWRRFRPDRSDERRRLLIERNGVDRWTITVSGPDGERIDAASGRLEQVLARTSVAGCLAAGCAPPWSAWQDLHRRAHRIPVGHHIVVSFVTR